jgi:hypothetical protein
MSVSIGEQSFQYVGILNGVMYRIDPSTGRSVEPMFGSQPLKTWSDFVRDEAPSSVRAALVTVTEELETVAEPAIEAVSIERIAVPSNLFPRSGGEPLRAGHPDLWALLVAGTCLEGSQFTSL